MVSADDRAPPARPLPLGFAARLIDWQIRHGRHGLPWQATRDPYRVWLSEIMLQQTQVATVLGYYDRFLAAFPDVEALAAASLDDVLARWSGLGYYRRARHLHAAARTVVERHGGRFPTTAAALAGLPGIGRSTAAAIAAFCFGERVAILDGNVRRVLTRLLAEDRDPADPRVERRLWAAATALLPEPGDGIERYTQGLMDLGAILCTTRAPSCLLCPVRDLCAGAASGRPEDFPAKGRALRRGARSSHWLWLDDADGRVWLVRRPEDGIWSGLWSFPEFASGDALAAATAGWDGAAEGLPGFVHVLTHLDWTLQPVRRRLPRRRRTPDDDALSALWPDGRWFGAGEALAVGLPSPLRKLLAAAAGRPDRE